MHLPGYHPGPFPEEPVHPGKRAHPTLKAWYYLQRFRWRNHHLKKSPWWDHLRKYYKSRAWKEIRKAALVRDRYKCQTCGKPAVQVHHKYYRYVGREWEQMSCLASICMRCHGQEHGELGFGGWLWKHLQPGKSVGGTSPPWARY